MKYGKISFFSMMFLILLGILAMILDSNEMNLVSFFLWLPSRFFYSATFLLFTSFFTAVISFGKNEKPKIYALLGISLCSLTIFIYFTAIVLIIYSLSKLDGWNVG